MIQAQPRTVGQRPRVTRSARTDSLQRKVWARQRELVRQSLLRIPEPRESAQRTWI